MTYLAMLYDLFYLTPFISRPEESRTIENEILLALTWIASSTINVRKGKG